MASFDARLKDINVTRILAFSTHPLLGSTDIQVEGNLLDTDGSDGDRVWIQLHLQPGCKFEVSDLGFDPDS